MNERATGSVLDYGGYVAERVQGFTGRDWVFREVDAWLGGSAPRSFLLTGEPGSGKTALAGRLSQISRVEAPAGNGYARLRTGFLGAMHFCSARAQRWITPHAFTESISLQLARYPAFARALAERAGDRDVRIVVRQEVGQAGGEVTGVIIERLDLSGIAPEDGFVRTVCEPLEALLAQDGDLRVCILVDALDEALLYSGPVGIVSLLARTADLPDRVRFILTSRPDERIENAFRDAAGLDLSGGEFAERNDADVRAYVAGRVTADARVAARVAALGPEAAGPLTEALTERAGGNFQYARFFLDAVADGARSLEGIEGLPVGLNGLYLDSLQRVVGLGADAWSTAYAPIMGILSVAQESLTLPQLRLLAGQADPEFWKHRGDLRQFIEEVPAGPGAERRYRLYHQSFADFLRLPEVQVEGKERTNPFFLPAPGWHERIADAYLAQFDGYWDECEDEYALRFVATHLAEAGRERERSERHRRVARLVGLVTDPEFQRAHDRRLADLPALQRDLERALRGAAADRHPEAVALVVEAATSLTAARRKYLRPDEPFELARAGKLETAEGRLALYTPEAEWRHAILLTLAWLAVPVDRAAAQALRDRVMAEGVAAPLPLLVARLDADLAGLPSPDLPDLPPAPDSNLVAGILDRLGGGSIETGIEPLSVEHHEGIQADADSAPMYLAEQDGPPLVAFAATDPARSSGPFREYVAIHAANGYLHYRNRSLWALVEPVLRHPDPAWAREMLVELERAALADTQIDFREGLPLAIQASRERAEPGAPGSGFPGRVAEARERAALPLDPERGTGDPWGHHLRRLAVLAEIHALVFGDRPAADGLLAQARALPFGFAGFRAPACLALAEASRVCRPEDPRAEDEALEQGLRAAHNVQDYVLCARATSRVNGIRARSRATPPAQADLAGEVPRFAAAPDAREFAAVHRVGEQYAMRRYGFQRLPIPWWALQAETLEALSRLFQRPRIRMLALNREAAADEHQSLPSGTPIHVPDPEFAPLLAARLAAEALTSPGLAPRARLELIQALAPLAAPDPTALDLVLTRLLLAAQPVEAAVLQRISDAVQRDRGESGGAPVEEIPLPPPGVPT